MWPASRSASSSSLARRWRSVAGCGRGSGVRAICRRIAAKTDSGSPVACLGYARTARRGPPRSVPTPVRTDRRATRSRRPRRARGARRFRCQSPSSLTPTSSSRAGPKGQEAIMPKQSSCRLSDQERAERRRQDRERLQRAAEELLCSEGWARWVKTRAMFHSYSAFIWRANVLVGKGSGGLPRRHVINGGAPGRWSDPRSDWSALDVAAGGPCPRTSIDSPTSAGRRGGSGSDRPPVRVTRG
jgi:hypothetical protein